MPKIKGGIRKLPLCEACHGKVHGLNFLNHKELTREGLKKAKQKGRVLGNPKNLNIKARIKGAESKRNIALKNENNIKETEEILFLRKNNKLSYQKIADFLNENNFFTSKLKKFTARAVQLLWIRYKQQNNK